MSKEEIALQLTLKALDRMMLPRTATDSSDFNQKFSKDVGDFYNYIYKNLDNTVNV